MNQKIITIIGTRPELIRLSLVIPKLDTILGKNHILIWTGQNFDPLLSTIFFDELNIRKPDYNLGMKGSLGEQLAIMFPQLEQIFIKEQPDKILILGDTNSGLSAIIAERMGIPVYHMEAGNRSGIKMPEEMNRHLIDNASTINLPYTQGSRENLLREGFNSKKIFVTGNPIFEVIEYNHDTIKKSNILNLLKLEPYKYILATLHRSENVDNIEIFKSIIHGYNLIARTKVPIIVSTHPHTQSKLLNLNIKMENNINFLSPFGFFDFIKLQQKAKVVLTDSGTCQEENTILKTPCVITRIATERPETIECGASILSGIKDIDIYNNYMYAQQMNTNWIPPKEYLDNNVSNKIVNYLMGGYCE